MPDNPTPRDATPTLAEQWEYWRSEGVHPELRWRVARRQIYVFDITDDCGWTESGYGYSTLLEYERLGEAARMTPAEIAATWPELAPAAPVVAGSGNTVGSKVFIEGVVAEVENDGDDYPIKVQYTSGDHNWHRVSDLKPCPPPDTAPAKQKREDEDVLKQIFFTLEAMDERLAVIEQQHTALAERDAARAEADTLRGERDAAVTALERQARVMETLKRICKERKDAAHLWRVTMPRFWKRYRRMEDDQFARDTAQNAHLKRLGGHVAELERKLRIKNVKLEAAEQRIAELSGPSLPDPPPAAPAPDPAADSLAGITARAEDALEALHTDIAAAKAATDPAGYREGQVLGLGQTVKVYGADGEKLWQATVTQLLIEPGIKRLTVYARDLQPATGWQQEGECYCGDVPVPASAGPCPVCHAATEGSDGQQ